MTTNFSDWSFLLYTLNKTCAYGNKNFVKILLTKSCFFIIKPIFVRTSILITSLPMRPQRYVTSGERSKLEQRPEVKPRSLWSRQILHCHRIIISYAKTSLCHFTANQFLFHSLGKHFSECILSTNVCTRYSIGISPMWNVEIISPSKHFLSFNYFHCLCMWL